MTLRNTSTAWGTIAKSFHWTMAVLIIAMLALGLYMTDLTPSPTMFRLYALHKSTGILILAIVALRLCWKGINRQPISLPSHAPWERLLAHLTHWFLYFAAVFMPLSGWVMTSAANFHVRVFMLFNLPDIVSPDKALSHRAGEFHSVLAWVLMGAIGLHILGALKHHVIDRDITLKRMLPFTRTEDMTP
jgi:cytochrome b561